MTAEISRRRLAALAGAAAMAPGAVMAAATGRDEVVRKLIAAVRANYQDEAIANRLADGLAKKLAAGAYRAQGPDEAFAADVDDILAALARKPPVAVRLGKAAFLSALETPLVPALEAMQAQLSLLTTTSDVAEGVSAFFEKRAPEWKGR